MFRLLFFLVLVWLLPVAGCRPKHRPPSPQAIGAIHLKRGPIVSCGPTDGQFGRADFKTSCSEKLRPEFNLAIQLLHSFEYDEAEKAFAKVIDQEPGCAMAYWGVAMANFHPLWTPPSEAELKKGAQAIELAQSLRPTGREAAYIEALAAFYQNWQTTDHRSRCLNFEKGMEQLYTHYPQDKEAAVFYALTLNAAADPADKSFSKQKKAGEILQALYPGQPNHPGIVHYLIHTYDYPELAEKGLMAARKYASVAPSSAHALHMPSHIFTRLGLWDECIRSNQASVLSARCYAEATGIQGHWDEELHGLDYLVYAYLQKGESDSAKKQWDYLNTITQVQPVNFKVAYAYAAIPSRYVLENRLWEEAARLQLFPAHFPWQQYPWQEALIHYARLLGSVHTNKLKVAKAELMILNRLHDTLLLQKDGYKANQVAIQIKSSQAWIKLKGGRGNEALALMQQAADMEDQTEKHPVTPGEVLPARELLGDLLLQLNQPAKALEAYEANLRKHPNRLNGLYGAGVAAERSGNMQKARSYFQQLDIVVGPARSMRPEVQKSKQYLSATAAL